MKCVLHIFPLQIIFFYFNLVESCEWKGKVLRTDRGSFALTSLSINEHREVEMIWNSLLTQKCVLAWGIYSLNQWRKWLFTGLLLRARHNTKLFTHLILMTDWSANVIQERKEFLKNEGGGRNEAGGRNGLLIWQEVPTARNVQKETRLLFAPNSGGGTSFCLRWKVGSGDIWGL